MVTGLDLCERARQENISSEQSEPKLGTEHCSADVHAASSASSQTLPVSYGRPDVMKIIHNAIDKASNSQRILVLCCGPNSLMTQVRGAVVERLRSAGPELELHCEGFGW